MRNCKWGLSMLLIMSFLAFSSSSWADKKPKHQRDRQGCDDQWDNARAITRPDGTRGKRPAGGAMIFLPAKRKKITGGINVNLNSMMKMIGGSTTTDPQ